MKKGVEIDYVVANVPKALMLVCSWTDEKSAEQAPPAATWEHVRHRRKAGEISARCALYLAPPRLHSEPHMTACPSVVRQTTSTGCLSTRSNATKGSSPVRRVTPRTYPGSRHGARPAATARA